MAKMTLLEVVQEILSDMNSDNVNSINDTIEAQQVVQIAKRTYFNRWARRNKVYTGRFFNQIRKYNWKKGTNTFVWKKFNI